MQKLPQQVKSSFAHAMSMRYQGFYLKVAMLQMAQTVARFCAKTGTANILCVF